MGGGAGAAPSPLVGLGGVANEAVAVVAEAGRGLPALPAPVAVPGEDPPRESDVESNREPMQLHSLYEAANFSGSRNTALCAR